MAKKRMAKKTEKKVEKKDKDTLVSELKAHQEAFKNVSEELDEQRSKLKLQLKRVVKFLEEIEALPQEQLVALRNTVGNLEVFPDLLENEKESRNHILWSGISLDLADRWTENPALIFPSLLPKVDKKDEKQKLKLMESAIKINQAGIAATSSMRKKVLDGCIDLKLWATEVIKYAESYGTFSEGQKKNVNNLIGLSLEASQQLITTINKNGEFKSN